MPIFGLRSYSQLLPWKLVPQGPFLTKTRPISICFGNSMIALQQILDNLKATVFQMLLLLSFST